MKRFLIFILLFITSFILIGCDDLSEESFPIEPDTPTLPGDDLVNDSKDDETIVPGDNQTNPEDLAYLQRIGKYIFIDVKNTSYAYLPLKLLDNSINWNYDNNEFKMSNNILYPKQDGTFNIKYSLKKNSAVYSSSLKITISGLKIQSTVQQNLYIHYAFINRNPQKIGGSYTPSNIIFHNTGNTASAKNEVAWLNDVSNTSSTSYHYAVDENSIYQAIPLSNYSYHSGNSKYNKTSIGIEIAKSLIADTAIKNKAINNATKFITLLRIYYGLSIEDIHTHQDASGKFCPHDIFNRYGLEKFYDDLKQFKV